MSDITGTSGNNNLNGGSGDDTMDGGAGNDIMSGGSGSDTMDGGSGSDRLNGGSGADTLIYTLAENAGATDIYTGGSGIDTIRLELTSAEWVRADVQSQIALYLQHLIAVKMNQNTGEVSNGAASDFTFAFDGSARLTVQMMERLDVWVDGLQFDFHAPFISAHEDGAVTEDVSVSAGNLSDSGSINFLDVDWTQSHSVTVTPCGSSTPIGTLTAAVTNAATGDGSGVVTWNYTVPNSGTQYLAAGEVMTETFTVTITDSLGSSDTQKVTITITGTNDGPVVQAVAAAADEDGAAVLGYFNGDDIDSDDNAGSLVYTITTVLAPGQGSVVNNNNGSFSFDPGTDFQGLAEGQTQLVTFDYTATDSHAAVSNTGTVTVTVTGTNDGPVVQAVAAAADEDGAAVLGYFNGDDIDSDDNAGSLVYTITTVLAPGQGSVVNNNNGSFSFDPGTDFQGLAEGQTQLVTFDYTATDSHAAVSNTGTVTVTVTGTNDGPVVQAVAAAADEDGAAVLGYFNGDDIDSDDNAGSLVYTITTVLAPGQGSVVNNNNGSFSFDPGTDFQGLAEGQTQLVTFDYTATDSHAAVSNTGTVTVTVTGTNDGPVVQAVAAAADEDGAAVLGYFNGDDIDSDDNAGSLVYTITTVLAPGQGSVVNNNNGSFSFDPGTDFQGLAEGQTQLVTFDYTATDSHAAVSNTGTVTVTVTGTNDAPAIQLITTDSASATLIETNLGLTTGGTLTVTDADTTDTVISSVTGVVVSGTTAGLTLTNAQLQSLLGVTPTTGLAANSGDTHNLAWTFDSGTEAFNYLDDGQSLTLTYTVQSTDNHSVSDTQTITVTINGTNDNVAAIDLNFSATASPGNSLPNGAFGQITAVDPDGGGAHTYSLAGLTATTLAGGAAANVAGDLTVSSAGVVSASNLDDDRIYSMAVEVTQGTATFTETFSVITGTNAANNISGSGDDVIFGQQNNDVILAGSGNDTVMGQVGSDTINGGDGNDALTGGNNNDTFVFDTALNGTTNVDTITDFNASSADKIGLDQSIFTALSLGAPLAAANFAANAGGNAAQADDYILYDTATGNLYYDADGNGAGDKILFATLTLSGVSGTVDNSDFNVIA